MLRMCYLFWQAFETLLVVNLDSSLSIEAVMLLSHSSYSKDQPSWTCLDSAFLWTEQWPRSVRVNSWCEMVL